MLGVHCKYVPRKVVFLKYVPLKVVFFEIFLRWFTNYSLYDIKKYFQKYNQKYHLSVVLGTVIKCPKGFIQDVSNILFQTQYI